MRVKVLFLGLIFIFLSGFISAQLSESDVVYVVPGEKVFHLEGCEKLGILYGNGNKARSRSEGIRALL